MEEKGNGTMALRTIPDIDVFLDKPRHVRFDYMAEGIAEREYSRFYNKGLPAEERQSFSIWDIRDAAAKAQRIAIAALLHGALVHEDPTLTFENVMGLIKGGAELNHVTAALRDAINAHYPTIKEDEKKTDAAAVASGQAEPSSGQ